MRVELAPAARPSDVVVALAVVSAALLAMARWWPFDRFPLSSCPLRTYAHVPCPGCGGTRAFQAVMRGDLPAAFHMSPLAALLAFAAAGLVGFLLLRLTVLKRGPRLVATKRERTWLTRTAWGAVLVNWVYLLVSGSAT